jgi:hypothetical protein
MKIAEISPLIESVLIEQFRRDGQSHSDFAALLRDLPTRRRVFAAPPQPRQATPAKGRAVSPAVLRDRRSEEKIVAAR